MNSFKTDFYLSIRIAIHSRLLSIALWFLIVLVVGVLLAMQFSARQPATVALDVGLSIIRITLPLLTILLVQELFSREFERKLYLTSFTYPHTRVSWLIGRTIAIIVIIATQLLLMSLTLALLTIVAGIGYDQATPVSLGLPYFVTLLFNAVDLLVVLAMAILLSVSAATPSFVLIGTIGFIIIARSYSPIISLLRDNPYVVGEFADPRIYQDSLGLLAFILPDLGRLDIRMIALYDKMLFLPTQWPLLVCASLAYIATLFALSAWILNKREFS